MLSCKDLLGELSDYLDDDLSAELRQDLEQHLSDCRPCQVVADSARMTVKIVTQCRSFELPPKLSVRIMTKIRGSASGPGGPGEESG